MKHKIIVALCIVLLVLTIGYTWNNSIKSVDKSNSESQAVANKIQTVVDNTAKEETSFKVSLLKLRKAAHMIEFMLIGTELSALAFILKKRFLPQSLWNIISASLAVAVVDESIQIWSGRGTAVRDILLDFCGALAGFLIALLVRFIITSCKKGKRKYVKN